MTADVVAWLTAKLDWVETVAATPIFHRPDLLRRAGVDRQILAEHASNGDERFPECVRCCAEGFEVELSDGRTVTGREAADYPCRTVQLLAEAWGWERQ